MSETYTIGLPMKHTLMTQTYEICNYTSTRETPLKQISEKYKALCKFTKKTKKGFPDKEVSKLMPEN